MKYGCHSMLSVCYVKFGMRVFLLLKKSEFEFFSVSCQIAGGGPAPSVHKEPWRRLVFQAEVMFLSLLK